MRVLVTGRDGQIARALAERAPAGVELVFAGRPDLDLEDAASIERTVAAVAPDLLISSAAYTAVDKAEDEAERAMRINGEAPGVLAAAARRAGARVLHLSTDYVFDGTLDRPYREDDPVAPLGVYGRSKLAGEQAVAASGATYAIARICWVYSPFGGNFVRTMLRLAADRDTVSVVADQHGCPGSALDIADALLRVPAVWRDAPQTGVDAIHHVASPAEASWADFAEAIFALSAARGGPSAAVKRITTADYPTRATRPANSRLDAARFAAVFRHSLRDWRDALPEVVDRLLASATP